ncbi:uncharacterized protein MEPE_02391 [Melanopsichium pennsylvanicum]|uniref:Uncharacterized protein n=1 Tax=Melanopsichium pennsylvanicum TaxID=63383 RepID=A0AAJ5C4N1_9BASI|nr:uncharacterized protein MEPE_02391 [Melanopsichium pennsylvanicum]
MSSATVSNEAIANLSSIAPIQPAIASNDPTSIVDATTKSTTDTIEATIVTDTKPENVPQKVTVTGLTPDQVLQELKKSGYVDQLRRQMLDTFFTATPSAPPVPVISAPTPSTTLTASSMTSSTPINAQQSVSSATLSNPSLRDTAATAHTLTPTAFSQPALFSTHSTSSLEVATTHQNMNLGSKITFLQFLSGPLRKLVEQQHDSLRIEERRGQQNNLLKLLETEPVDYASRDTSGEASVYDLLIRHIVTSSTFSFSESTSKASDGHVGFTTGMLAKNGKFGTEMQKKITDTIKDLLNPTSKDDQDERDDDDDDDDEQQQQQQQEEEEVEQEEEDHLNHAETQKVVSTLTTQPSHQSHTDTSTAMETN